MPNNPYFGYDERKAGFAEFRAWVTRYEGQFATEAEREAFREGVRRTLQRAQSEIHELETLTGAK